jgi:hypothetical protein
VAKHLGDNPVGDKLRVVYLVIFVAHRRSSSASPKLMILENTEATLAAITEDQAPGGKHAWERPLC